MPPNWPTTLTHRDLADRARGIGAYDGIGTPQPHGTIVPPGMGGTPQPARPDPSTNPGGGREPQGNPPRPDALGTKWEPGGSFSDGRVASEGAGGNSPLASIAPERFTPQQTVGNVDRYGENSAGFWAGKGRKP